MTEIELGPETLEAVRELTRQFERMANGLSNLDYLDLHVKYICEAMGLDIPAGSVVGRPL